MAEPALAQGRIETSNYSLYKIPEKKFVYESSIQCLKQSSSVDTIPFVWLCGMHCLTHVLLEFGQGHIADA